MKMRNKFLEIKTKIVLKNIKFDQYMSKNCYLYLTVDFDGVGIEKVEELPYKEIKKTKNGMYRWKKKGITFENWQVVHFPDELEKMAKIHMYALGYKSDVFEITEITM